MNFDLVFCIALFDDIKQNYVARLFASITYFLMLCDDFFVILEKRCACTLVDKWHVVISMYKHFASLRI